MTTRVIVIGAGIGGLAAAAALRGRGFACAVYERSPTLEPVGAGIALWANALHALRKLGFDGELPAYREPFVAGIRTPDGRLIIATESEYLRRKFGEISAVIHRAELQDILLRLAGGEVHLGKALLDVEERNREVIVRFSDGTEATGDVLIGADGIHSVVRSRLHPDGPSLRYAGYTAWRGVTSIDPQRLLPGETWGHGARFGQMPLSENRAYWFATANTPAGSRAREGEKAELLRRFQGWHAPIEELIETIPEEAIMRHDIYDRPPTRDWGRGHITLLGDAAHPTTPNLGQGGCMAIEDAVVLAECMERVEDLASALRAYERARQPRTAQLVRQAWKLGRIGQWENGLAVSFRNTAVRLLMPWVQERQLESIIGYRV
jgi:2-polyprenyl-6-methoxyphenol hydroxylase-like FAD-dependent oxidoreductase